jgi:hypothetical protein
MPMMRTEGLVDEQDRNEAMIEILKVLGPVGGGAIGAANAPLGTAFGGAADAVSRALKQRNAKIKQEIDRRDPKK